MKQYLLLNVLLISFYLFNGSKSYNLKQLISSNNNNNSNKPKHYVKIRSLFNQIKSFAKEIFRNNDDTSVGHLLIEHIENCLFTCENDGKFVLFI